MHYPWSKFWLKFPQFVPGTPPESPNQAEPLQLTPLDLEERLWSELLAPFPRVNPATLQRRLILSA